MSERNERIRAELIALLESDPELKRRDGKLPYESFAHRCGIKTRIYVYQWANGTCGISAANLEKIRAVYPDFARK